MEALAHGPTYQPELTTYYSHLVKLSLVWLFILNDWSRMA